MIKLNTVYKAGKQEVKFQEKEPGLVYAEYGDETVEGKMEGNTLKAIFHNKKVNVTGLMELTFHETGFEGRWKKGIEPGELKQKWNAVLVEDKNPTNESKNGYLVFMDEDNIRYEGEWENDEFISGKAEYVDEDGEKVIEEGIFEQGNLNEGKITWSDGNAASGTFDEELELNGKGIYTWSNGDFQDGTWVHGEFKDGKAKITHDDGEISEGMMKDGEWVEEEEIDEEKSMSKIVPKIPSPSNLSNLFSQGNFEAVCFHADLSFEYSNKVLDKIIVSAMKTNNSELFSSCKATIDKFRWDWWTKKGNGEFHTKWNKYFEENLNLLNSGNKNELKSEIEFNQTSQKLSVDHETNLIGSQDRPEKSPIRSLAANMNKLFDKQDYEGVCIYADLSREYPNDVFDKILISAVKTLNNEMFNKCKSKFDARDIIWDFEGENRKFKVKWLLFFDENKKLLNKNNEIKLSADLKKYENEIKEEILIVNTKVYKSGEFDSEEKYEGETLNGDYHGKGTYTWPNGQRYIGDWIKGKLHGKGIYTWPNGQKYEGDFLRGERHGRGTQTWPDGQWKEGTWENDEFMAGKGRWIFDGGDTYEGERSQGAWNGKGKYKWSSGKIYEGEWKDGEQHGMGKLLNSDGSIKYEGYFTEGYSNNWYDEIDELIKKIAEDNGYNKNFKKLMGSIFSIFSSEEKSLVNNIDKAINDLNLKFADKNYISYVQDFTILFYSKKLAPFDDYSEIIIKFLKSLRELIEIEIDFGKLVAIFQKLIDNVELDKIKADFWSIMIKKSLLTFDKIRIDERWLYDPYSDEDIRILGNLRGRPSENKAALRLLISSIEGYKGSVNRLNNYENFNKLEEMARGTLSWKPLEPKAARNKDGSLDMRHKENR